MSNFGPSSLGNTKVGACREHEDSGRGKCFMPGLIRADRNYKGASPSEGRDEEVSEGGSREERKKPNGWQKSRPQKCGVVLIHACQCLLM